MRAFGITAAVAALVSGVVVMAGQQPPAAPAASPFTAAQATAGRTAFDQNCSTCHGTDLSGGAAPALAGTFPAGWSARTTRDLTGLIQGTMPPDRAGALPEQDYVNIAAYILQFNGATPGTQALTTATAVPIGS